VIYDVVFGWGRGFDCLGIEGEGEGEGEMEFPPMKLRGER
jgi:hypothetical protein